MRTRICIHPITDFIFTLNRNTIADFKKTLKQKGIHNFSVGPTLCLSSVTDEHELALIHITLVEVAVQNREDLRSLHKFHTTNTTPQIEELARAYERPSLYDLVLNHKDKVQNDKLFTFLFLNAKENIIWLDLFNKDRSLLIDELLHYGYYHQSEAKDIPVSLLSKACTKSTLQILVDSNTISQDCT